MLVSVFNKVAGLYCEYTEILKNIFFIENLPWVLLKYSLISQENISGEGLIDLQSYLVK